MAKLLLTHAGSRRVSPGSEILLSGNRLNQTRSTGNHPIRSMFPLFNVIMQKGIMYAVFTKW